MTKRRKKDHKVASWDNITDQQTRPIVAIDEANKRETSLTSLSSRARTEGSEIGLRFLKVGTIGSADRLWRAYPIRKVEN